MSDQKRSNEKERVSWLTAELAESTHPNPNIDLKVGLSAPDDAAVLRLPPGMDLVAASDFVRGTGFVAFEAGLLGFYDIGYYLASANLSDIASMGAVPIGMTAAIRYNQSVGDLDFQQILLGIADSCRAVGALLLGGDSGGAPTPVLSAAAFGYVEEGKALLRSSGQPGDSVLVTGAIGRAGALAMLLGSGTSHNLLSEEGLADLLSAWKRPTARVSAGRALVESGWRIACQDVSDGLKSTVREVAEASGSGAEIFKEALPIPDSVIETARLMEVDVVELAMGASPDFELLFTCPPECVDSLVSSIASMGVPVTVVGRLTSEVGSLRLSSGGVLTSLPGQEWKHEEGGIGDLASRLQRGSDT